LAFLIELFPDTDVDIVIKILIDCRNLEDSISQLSNFLIVEEEVNDESKSMAEEMVKLFPECDRNFIYSFVGANAEMDLYLMIDELIMQLVEYKNNPSKRKYRPLEEKVELQKLKDKINPKLSFKDALIEGDDVLKNTTKEETVRTYKPFSLSKVCESPLHDGRYYRGIVSELIQRRSELYAKASKAFQAKGFEGRTSAAFYSEQARAINPEIEYYSTLAVYAIFKTNNPDAYSNIIDLHHLTISEAISILSSYLHHHFEDQQRYKRIYIVTGSGRRSKNGIRLRPAVYHFLSSNDWRFNFDSLSVFEVFNEKIKGKK
jgi:hypothetical protein